ncbi:M15 family metallopeptidase [Aquimarina sp. U1-2]|nr:M15 family metallopeptidase [Aquimarina sp. U1-2]
MIRTLVIAIFLAPFFSCITVVEDFSESRTAALIEKSKALRLRGEKVEQSLHHKKDSIELLYGDTSTIEDASDTNDFINIERISNDFVLDMRYATKNNFLKEKVYACAKCYVRDEVADALIEANQDFIKQGYRIKFFDCYRPHSVQKKMWKIYPNPGYVANPKGGSIHNKGAAVDITLVKLDGSTVDMGTDFDHFGKEAHHAYRNHAEDVLKHRKLLKETMNKHGFRTIRTEWWHYNYKNSLKYKISDFTWECN